MSKDIHPQTLDPRIAGQVIRYHTWPQLRQTSVAEHSWQLMRIVLALWPEAPRHVLIHILVHDIGERVTGDIPYPVKSQNAEIKKAISSLERDAHLAMCKPWGLPPPQQLTEEEHAVVKLAEYVEMWEWALHEIELGNQHARLVAERCVAALYGRQLIYSDSVSANLVALWQRRRAWHEKLMSGYDDSTNNDNTNPSRTS